MFNKVVGLGHSVADEGGLRQIVQAFKTAALQQFCKTAFQRHFEAWVRAERSEDAAGSRVHQGDAHNRVDATQRRILHQHREALFFQPLNARHYAGVLRQYFGRDIGQRDFAFQNFALYRALENLGQALHLRFGQRITGTHAITGVKVLDQVGREIHHLAVRVSHKGEGTDAALYIARVGVVKVRAT